MDIDELRYFLAISEYRNISDAAISCSVSQSVISKHLVKLENELGGVELCNRNRRPLSLTPAGEEFLQYATRIVDEYNQLMNSMNKYILQPDDALRIGSIPVMSRMGIVNMISEYMETRSTPINVSVIDRPSFELIDLLENDELDAAILILAPEMNLKNRFTCYTLTVNTLKLAVNKKHRFANRSSVSIRELVNEHIYLADSKTGMYSISSKVLLENGVNSSNIKSYRNIDMVVSMVQANRGVTLMSDLLVNSYNDSNIKILPIDIKIESTMALVIRNNPHIKKELKEFVDFVLKNRKIW